MAKAIGVVMLNIRDVKHLARYVGLSRAELRHVCDHVDDYCEELILLDPANPDKPREVLNVRGDLRKIQDAILRRILMPKLKPSPYAHGGIKGRHIKTNVQAHLDSVYVFTADITKFYPTISRNRVYRLFVNNGCTPDVAHMLTRLCTHKHRTALGLITSPFIAEQILKAIDRRISAACDKAGLTYTRYVDDISISGKFNLKGSGFEATVSEILHEHGFRINPKKSIFGRLDEGTAITKIVVRKGHPDIRREYLEELDRQLNDSINLANGRPMTGLYYTRNQILGRIRFVGWINPGRKRKLMAKFKTIPWGDVAKEAKLLRLVQSKKKLVPANKTTIGLNLSQKTSVSQVADNDTSKLSSQP